MVVTIMKAKRGQKVFSSANPSTSFNKLKLKQKRKEMRKKRRPKPINSEPVQKRKQTKRKPKVKKELSEDEVRKLQLLKANEEEDKTIRKMEKLLGLKKRKAKTLPKSFAADGLDYLLDVVEGRLSTEAGDFTDALDCDVDVEKNPTEKFQSESEEYMSGEDMNEMESGEDMNEMESGEDMNEAESGEDMNGAENEDMNEMESDEDKNGTVSGEDMNEMESGEDMNEIESGEDMNEIESDECANATGSGKDMSETQSDENDETESCQNSGTNQQSTVKSKKHNKTSAYKEDIYGRLIDKKGNIVKTKTGSYIPPAKRTDAGSDILKRQLKGNINRLSEANLHSISSQVESLYGSNSRHSVNESLSELILESVCQPILTPERLVMEHTVLIAILHANVGTECGAHILEQVVTKFHKVYNTELTKDFCDKKIHNVAQLLSHLYTFKVCGSGLIYDILYYLAGEKDQDFIALGLDLILVLLRSVGFLLRKDNPEKLKDLIEFLHVKSSKQKLEENESRVKWMLDTLLAIRNNNMRNIPQYDPTLAEHLRKVLRTHVRSGNYITPLVVSLDDLLNAETRGKWWIVGSSWEGKDETQSTTHKQIDENSKLLNLAKQQRMSTDARKQIFCCIMSAEDYIDARDKLLGLGLEGSKERDIFHVLIDCCIQEKSYNPYYSHLAQAVCRRDRKYKRSLQFLLQMSLWDRIKELASFKISQRNNLAEFTAHLLANQALPLSALKVLELSELDKHRSRYLKLVLTRLLLDIDSETCINIFHSVSKVGKLKLFREGLRLFMRHFLLKNKSLSADNASILEAKILVAERGLRGGSSLAL